VSTEVKKKERGSNITPKQEMHVGRDWSQASWNQAFDALCAKWDKANYARRSEGGPRRPEKAGLADAPRVEKIPKKQPVVEYK
jgi:hypothetical protein